MHAELNLHVLTCKGVTSSADAEYNREQSKQMMIIIFWEMIIIIGTAVETSNLTE
jgi:hypothetical protein